MTRAKAIDVNESSTPTFDLKGEPLRHDVLNKTDLVENSNKFFSLELQESRQGTFRVLTNYGRVGHAGVMDGRYFKTQYDAEAEYDRILRSKTSPKKGYVKVAVAKAAVGSEVARQKVLVTDLPKNAKVTSKVLSSSKLHKEIQTFVAQVYEDATEKLTQSYNVTISDQGVQTPLGALSQGQLDLGKTILKDIRKYLQDTPTPKQKSILIQLTGKYFSNIPRILPHRPDPEEVAILDVKKADAEEELLLLMQDVFDLKGEVTSDIDHKYEALKTQIGFLDPLSSEYQRIVSYVKKSESRHHDITVKINRIFQLDLQADSPRFNPSTISPVRELFHGTRNSNILGISTKGLMVAPKNVPSTGYMFGKGIYFADQSTKSTQYSVGRYTGGNGGKDNAFLFLADVAVGRMKEYQNSHYQDTAPQGYHSVKGVAGSSLLHNEYIVYNVNQARIRFVVDFTAKYKY